MIKKVGKVIQQIIIILLDSVIRLVHLTILSALGLIILIMGLSSLLLPTFGLFRAFGADKIPILWDDFQVPIILSIPIGLFFGIICALITWISLRGIMKCFDWVSKNKGSNKK